MPSSAKLNNLDQVASRIIKLKLAMTAGTFDPVRYFEMAYFQKGFDPVQHPRELPPTVF